MKKSLINFASNIFGKHKPAVARMRFFVNPLIDAELNNADALHIPDDSIKTMISDIEQKIRNKVKPIVANATDGLYLGTAGIAYMFYHLSKTSNLNSRHKEFMQQALQYLNPALTVAEETSTRKSDLPGFILGNSGIYAVAAAIYKTAADEGLSKTYLELFHKIAVICKQPHFLRCGSDEYFVGRAGYVLGALWLANETQTPLAKQDIFEICRVMVNSGREYAKTNNYPCPLMYAYYDVEYFGAAHGLCTILQALISVPDFLDSHPAEAKDIKDTIDYLLSLQDSEGNFPAAADEIHQKKHDLVHWCHGAPGIIYLMAKAYLIWREEKYLKSCEKAADLIWLKGLLKKGPGICHGVAGNGYTFLLMYRLTENEKYLKRAEAFAQFLEYPQFKAEARTPDYPYSLYEGIAGTACFLADLIEPSKAAFPFSDIFTTYK